jgi:hypothetical protein
VGAWGGDFCGGVFGGVGLGWVRGLRVLYEVDTWH